MKRCIATVLWENVTKQIQNDQRDDDDDDKQQRLSYDREREREIKQKPNMIRHALLLQQQILKDK